MRITFMFLLISVSSLFSNAYVCFDENEVRSALSSVTSNKLQRLLMYDDLNNLVQEALRENPSVGEPGSKEGMVLETVLEVEPQDLLREMRLAVFTKGLLLVIKKMETQRLPLLTDPLDLGFTGDSSSQKASDWRFFTIDTTLALFDAFDIHYLKRLLEKYPFWQPALEVVFLKNALRHYYSELIILKNWVAALTRLYVSGLKNKTISADTYTTCSFEIITPLTESVEWGFLQLQQGRFDKKHWNALRSFTKQAHNLYDLQGLSSELEELKGFGKKSNFAQEADKASRARQSCPQLPTLRPDLSLLNPVSSGFSCSKEGFPKAPTSDAGLQAIASDLIPFSPRSCNRSVPIFIPNRGGPSDRPPFAGSSSPPCVLEQKRRRGLAYYTRLSPSSGEENVPEDAGSSGSSLRSPSSPRSSLESLPTPNESLESLPTLNRTSFGSDSPPAVGPTPANSLNTSPTSFYYQPLEKGGKLQKFWSRFMSPRS